MHWPTIEKLQYKLREDHRIKRNVDYAIMHKQDAIHLMCNEVFYDTIVEVASSLGLRFATVHFTS